MKSLVSFQCQISRPFEFESVKLLCVKKIYDTHIKVSYSTYYIYADTHLCWGSWFHSYSIYFMLTTLIIKCLCEKETGLPLLFFFFQSLDGFFSFGF